MLQNTFIHIPGICEKRERLLWEAGITHWDDIEKTECSELQKLTHLTFIEIQKAIEKSKQHLEQKDTRYFSQALKGNDYWRMYPEFRDEVAYIDIETTGLSNEQNEITTIALYDGENIKYYVRGRNLHEFVNDIFTYKMIVTFNGKCFDVPFIEREFGIDLNHAHIDLRFVLKSLGYRGGLKSCEKQLGIDRHELDGVDGYFAVLLWHDYILQANEKALETLLAYNIEDVINLETLLIKSYNEKIALTPVSVDELSLYGTRPELPFSPDLETIDRIRMKLSYQRWRR